MPSASTFIEDLQRRGRSRSSTWNCPREIDFRAQFPKTLVGKIAFNTLREQELARHSPDPQP